LFHAAPTQNHVAETSRWFVSGQLSRFGAARLHPGCGKRDTMGRMTKLPKIAMAEARAFSADDQDAVAMLPMAQETRGLR
jgi:hypothetical protein